MSVLEVRLLLRFFLFNVSSRIAANAATQFAPGSYTTQLGAKTQTGNKVLVNFVNKLQYSARANQFEIMSQIKPLV